MPIRGSPNGAYHPHPQAGRDRPEWVVAINRNAWSQSIGIAGRNHPVRANWCGVTNLTRGAKRLRSAYELCGAQWSNLSAASVNTNSQAGSPMTFGNYLRERWRSPARNC